MFSQAFICEKTKRTFRSLPRVRSRENQEGPLPPPLMKVTAPPHRAVLGPGLGLRLRVLAVLAAVAAVGMARDGAFGDLARLRRLACCKRANSRRAPGRMLRLRGGYRATDRVLQARMAAARAEVAAGWYNATATDVFPWDGWDTHRREELEGAPHVGFLGGTGRWLGPSLEQVRYCCGSVFRGWSPLLAVGRPVPA